MDAMKIVLQDALDDLVSSRSSTESRGNALSTLERVLALACVPAEKPEEFYTFLALQDTFECNVPSRLLAWVASSTSKLEVLTNKGSMDHEQELEASALSSQMCLSLSIIQGVALHHGATKSYLGRRYALKVLLELLLASRHLSAIPLTTPNATSSDTGVPLSSVVLDTVLCILVDSSPALRVFEESNGVQAVVKMLKRAGTPREVRMKCLEFLYFYLLDETSPGSMTIAQEPTPPPTAPTTPHRKTLTRSRTLAPRISTSKSFSHSRSSSDFSLSSISTTSSFSSSFSSTSSNASCSTDVTSPTSTDSTSPTTTTPPRTPPLPTKQARPLFMLRKDVDFVPQSPKRAFVVPPSPSRPALSCTLKSPTKQQDSPKTARKALDVGVGGRVKSLPRSRLGSGGDDENRSVRVAQEDGAKEMLDDSGKMMGAPGEMEYESESVGTGMPMRTKTRTTDEKRRILGSMLGNVDALVEGVRKAGIRGFG